MIWLGCSGWSYGDWNGSFYPPSSHGRLEFYTKIFNSVEVNVTFYRKVSPKTVEQWIRTASKTGRFRFSIKAPRSITHEQVSAHIRNAKDELNGFAHDTLKPISQANLAGSFLLQFPSSLGHSRIGDVISLISDVDIYDFNGVLEFRNQTLASDNRLKKMIHDQGYVFASTDSPQGKICKNLDTGNGVSYFRFHGRNSADWFSRNENPSARYDYKYSREELTDLSRYVMRSIEAGDEIFVYFNNHPGGKAPSNAIEFSSILGMGTARQRHLF